MTRANKALLTVLVALVLWHGDTAMTDLLQPAPIVSNQIPVMPARYDRLFPCNDRGDEERRRACTSQIRMSKVKRKGI